MNKISILLFYLISTSVTIACKKENPVKEKFDLKNYAVHHVYRESNGAGTEYKGPLQLIIFENNSKLNIKHAGATAVANLPTNITVFNVYDGFYNNADSLSVSIDTTNRTAEMFAQNGRTRNSMETNLIDIREKNWNLNNLSLKGTVKTYNTLGTLLQSAVTYVAFNSDGSKTVMQETPISGSTVFTNTINFGETTNYYRESARSNAQLNERLFFVFLKQKVVLSGTYVDLVTSNVFYYYGELTQQ
ncbi:MAG: hypothetical protein RIS29_659 [Bacteroidota bacterium]|jgi:hypothetical protein